MKNLSVTLSAGDRAILNSYKNFLDGMAEYCGSGYEIVLHSLEDLEHSAIKVVNGYHTGRTEGAPITELALNMLRQIHQDPARKDYICYNTVNKDGSPLHSTTIAIRGMQNRIIGLVCINFYIDTPISEWIRPFALRPVEKEVYVQNTDEMIRATTQKVALEVDAEGYAELPTRNKEIVNRLYARGIFQIKDAVLKVAEELNISKNTVYMHLRNLKNGGERRP
ncbi:MAG: PAS domain-containing protein [Clostridiales bacterium]|nr:PAS domain-containing protein [Clostridiales bacterium]